MEQLHILISGQVQGVGLRWFIRNQAEKLGIHGWVKNTESGQVEAVFQGEKKTAQTLIELFKSHFNISEVRVEEINSSDEKENFEEFKIIT